MSTPSATGVSIEEKIKRLKQINYDLWAECTVPWRHDLYKEAETILASLSASVLSAPTDEEVKEESASGPNPDTVEAATVQGLEATRRELKKAIALIQAERIGLAEFKNGEVRAVYQEMFDQINTPILAALAQIDSLINENSRSTH